MQEENKKSGKIITGIFIVLIIIAVMFVYSVFQTTTINIKTEYGDKFSVLCDDFGDLYVISDVNSDFNTGLYYFGSKKDFHSVCDNQYIRCYRISDGSEDGYKDKFIFKIKKYDEFFSVRYGDVKYSSEYMFKDDAEKVKSELLCDNTLMEICLHDLDSLYHDELIEMGEKFINRDFEGLDKYGLTEKMIQDDESLEEKIKVMVGYLRKNH